MTQPIRLLVLGALGCTSYAARGRAVSTADVGTDAARITNFLTLKMNGNEMPEMTSNGVPREAVVDEAVLAVANGGQTCIDITMRTFVNLDQPLSTWTFKINDQEVSPQNETVTVRDYPYRGQQALLVAEAVSVDSFATLTINEPTEEIYRVFERNARLCGAGSRSISLLAELTKGSGMGSWGEVFRWEVR